MNIRIRLIALAIVVAVLTAAKPAWAQKVTTKPPTAADWAALAKLPDFSGVWEAGAVGGGRGAAARGADAGRGTDAARGGAPAAGRAAAQGAGRGRGGGPQLTPEWAAKRAAALANPPEDSPAANCLPPGMPGIMGQPYPMEFLLTPGKVTIVIEAYTQVRHIYTDGRPLPDDPDPKFFGTSVGRWEGDTLIVDTVGFSEFALIDRGVPLGPKARIVERLRLSDPDVMTIETTVNDPGRLLAPLTTTRTLRRHRDWTIAEYICEENNRNSVDLTTGKAGINLNAPGSPSKK